MTSPPSAPPARASRFEAQPPPSPRRAAAHGRRRLRRLRGGGPARRAGRGRGRRAVRGGLRRRRRRSPGTRRAASRSTRQLGAGRARVLPQRRPALLGRARGRPRRRAARRVRRCPALRRAAAATARCGRDAARARAGGSWADGLRVGAALLEHAGSRCSAPTAGALAVELEAGRGRSCRRPAADPRPTGCTRRRRGAPTVDAARPARRRGAPAHGARVGDAVALARGAAPAAPARAAELRSADVDGAARVADAGRRDGVAATVDRRARPARCDLPAAERSPRAGRRARWCGCEPAARDAAGSRVDDAGASDDGRLAWRRPPALRAGADAASAAPPAAATPRSSGSTLELWVARGDDGERIVLGGLGFAPGHPRFVGDLPDRRAALRAARPTARPRAALWARRRATRASRSPAPATAAPGLPARRRRSLPSPSLGAAAARPAPRARARRARRASAPRCSSTDALRDDAASTPLLATADYLRWHEPATAPRCAGIHALLGVDEVTLRRRPGRGAARLATPAARRPPPAPPAAPATAGVAGRLPSDASHDCALRRVAADAASSRRGRATRRGSVRASSWTARRRAGRALRARGGAPTRATATTRAIVYRGPRARVDALRPRARRALLPRARRGRAERRATWSARLAVGRAARRPATCSRADADYRPRRLLAVQRALLRMCAARGDLLAVLSLPEHYREDEALAHVAALRRADGDAARSDACRRSAPARRGRSASARSTTRGSCTARPSDGRALRAAPPDGAVAGVIARRAPRRAAPGSRRRTSRCATSSRSTAPSRAGARPALQDAQVNVAAPGAARLPVAVAPTRSAADAELRPINVRRLLLAAAPRWRCARARSYVFEPNDAVLPPRGRSAASRRCSATSSRAARSPARPPSEAFRVVVGDPPNTPAERRRRAGSSSSCASRRRGRSTFLTVRLVQAGERGFRLVDALMPSPTTPPRARSPPSTSRSRSRVDGRRAAGRAAPRSPSATGSR